VPQQALALGEVHQVDDVLYELVLEVEPLQKDDVAAVVG